MDERKTAFGLVAIAAIIMALLLTGCSENPTAPSQTPPQAPGQPISASGGHGFIDHTLRASAFTYVLHGPSGCVEPGDYHWDLDVLDAGDEGGHVVVAAFHTGGAGCEATSHMAAGGVYITSGLTVYTAHGIGVTGIDYYERRSCGRVQVDIAWDNGNNGDRETIGAIVVNYGENCESTPLPPPPTCTVDCGNPPSPPPPFPPPPVCEVSYSGPRAVELPNSGAETELAWVRHNIVGGDSLVSSVGEGSVALVKAGRLTYIFLNGEPIDVPQEISHISWFNCP